MGKRYEQMDLKRKYERFLNIWRLSTSFIIKKYKLELCKNYIFTWKIGKDKNKW